MRSIMITRLTDTAVDLENSEFVSHGSYRRMVQDASLCGLIHYLQWKFFKN